MKNRILTLTLLLLLATSAGAQTTTVTLHPNDGLWNFSSLGVTLTSGQLLLPDGTAAKPSIARSAGPTTGFHFVAGGVLFGVSGTNLFAAATPSGLYVKSDLPIGFSSSDPEVGAPDVRIYRDAANTLGLRNGTAAQTFNVYNTYTDASNYERVAITGGTSMSILTQKAGTGAQLNLAFGATGAVNWSIRAAAAGDTPAGSFYPVIGDDTVDIGQYNVRVRQLQLTRSIQGNKTKALTESSATAAWDCALAAGAHTGGTLHYCVYAADATDQQERCASIKVSAVNKAGTTTCVMSPGTVNETTDGNAGALSAGTLTYAVTCTDTTDSFGILFNAVSSLTQTTLQSESRWDIMTPATCTPQ